MISIIRKFSNKESVLVITKAFFYAFFGNKLLPFYYLLKYWYLISYLQGNKVIVKTIIILDNIYIPILYTEYYLLPITNIWFKLCRFDNLA